MQGWQDCEQLPGMQLQYTTEPQVVQALSPGWMFTALKSNKVSSASCTSQEKKLKSLYSPPFSMFINGIHCNDMWQGPLVSMVLKEDWEKSWVIGLLSPDSCLQGHCKKQNAELAEPFGFPSRSPSICSHR